MLICALGFLGCTENAVARREREALAYGAALSEVARFEPAGDTIFVQAELHTWPDSIAMEAVRGRFLRSTDDSDLMKRMARAVTRPGRLEVPPTVPGRVVRVVDGAKSPSGTTFQLSPVAFTAHKDSAVVYVEHFIYNGIFQSYELLLVGREADGQWKRLEYLGGAVAERSTRPMPLAVLPE